MKLDLTSFSATRSCGRFGPASDGSMLASSSLSTSVKIGSGVDLVRIQALRLGVGLDQLDAAPAGRLVSVRYWIVSSSIGKKPQVAPYSGAMLPIVARSAIVRPARPGPKNSTNLPTTPRLRSICVTVSTRSVAVMPSLSLPVSLTPITSGRTIEYGWPSMAASASMPPTPQPSTERPLTMVVCESVPTSVSG